MKHVIWNDMKLVNVNVDEMQVFVTTNKFGIMINTDVNAKNWLTKEDVKKDLFEILVIVNVINHAMLENICIAEIVGVVKDYSEDINGNKMNYNVSLNYHRKVCNSCTIYIVLLIIISTTLMALAVYIFVFIWIG